MKVRKSNAAFIFIALFVANSVLAGNTPNANDGCAYDQKKLLSLDFLKFDQDTLNGGGGWRAVAAKKGCNLAAADLVKSYRNAHPELKGHQPGTMLFWHEGQLRAFEGQNTQAIELMKQSKAPAEFDKAGWNAYVDATTAFLAHDKENLLKAKEALAATPSMDDLPVKDGKITVKLDNGQIMSMDWPPNSGIVDGFVRCFDKPYKEAYISPCRTGVQK